MSEECAKYFSNSKEELEFYKNNYKSNVEELLTCKTKIKALENINNKLKEKISFLFSKNSPGNESSNFYPTNNEFKKIWESAIQTDLIDPFDFCIKEYKLISNLCQDIMLLVYEETKKIIELKFLEILKCLNLSKTTKNKKDNLFEKILPFFRENFNSIFEFNDEKIKNIKQKLKNVINQYNFWSEIKLYNSSSNKLLNDIQQNNNLNNSSLRNNNTNNNENSFRNSNISKLNNVENIKILEAKIKGKNFEGIMKSFFNICLYMLLHEPILNFNIEKYSQRKLLYYFYNKNDFINVEGFGDERTPCILILQPPLLKNKYPFNGLKPAVYILSDVTINKEIIKLCEINEKKLKEENNVNDINNQDANNNKKINNLNKSNETRVKAKKKIGKNNMSSKLNEENNNININQTKVIKYKNENNSNIINNNNIKNNNFSQTMNKSGKIITNKYKIEEKTEKYVSHKIVNRNVNYKQNKASNNQKYDNNLGANKNNNNNIIKNNNKFKSSNYQNISYGYIQNNQNMTVSNQINYKMNYSKNNNIRLNNFTNNNTKINDQLMNNESETYRKRRKQIILQDQYQYGAEFTIYDKNPNLNYSHKISREKNKNNHQIDIHQKRLNSFGKSEKIIRNKIPLSTSPNNIRMNMNNQGTKLKRKNNLNNNKNNNKMYNNNNNINSLNKSKTNDINYIQKYQYHLERNKTSDEKYKKNNFIHLIDNLNINNIPSSEKINIKYYSSFNNILSEENNNYSRQLTKFQNSIININNNNNNNNYNSIKKINTSEINLNDQFIIDKNGNYHSYAENDNLNENVNEINKITDRKLIRNNRNNININKERGLETSIQRNKYNGFDLNQIKQNYTIKKNNLIPLFNAMNNYTNENLENTKYKMLETQKKKNNQKINYINSINNINNYNNINNINNINYYNNIYNNSYMNDYNISQKYLNDNSIQTNAHNSVNKNSKTILRNSMKEKWINIEGDNNQKNLVSNPFKSNDYRVKTFNQTLNINNIENQYETNNIMLKNFNSQEINNDESNERNQLGQCLSPAYLKIQNKINNQNNQNIQRIRINKNKSINQKNNINKLTENNRVKESNQRYNENRNTRNYNQINTNQHLNDINNNNLNYRFSKLGNYNLQENIIINNKTDKKRNKSLNSNAIHLNNLNQVYYPINKNKKNYNHSNNSQYENLYKTDVYNYYNNMNKNENENENNNYRTFKSNTNERIFMNEMEVLKINNQYKYNNSFLQKF